MSTRLDLVVLGGGPAAFAAARGYRDAGGSGAVAIVADERRLPYNRPSLSKELLRGEMDERELPLADDEWLGSEDVRLLGGAAVAIDASERTVALAGGEVVGYDNCVLATGGEPTRLPVPGADDRTVHVFRSLDDLHHLKAHLSGGGPVVVIGSGFIGCEIAASLRRTGHPVTLVSDEPAPNTARLGDEAGERIAGWLEEEGVVLRLGAAVERIASGDTGAVVHTEHGSAEGEVVVMATGITPRSRLAEAAGTAISDDGRVRVDAKMRTSLEGVLAAGDVALAHNAAAGRPLRIEHWGDALAQGEVAGRTAAGAPSTWADVPGFWSSIGSRTLKHAAWGDGFDEVRFEPHDGRGFTAWYGAGGRLVGVLAHEADADYERGRELVAEGAPW